MKETIVAETHSQFAIKYLDLIFTNPIFNSGRFKTESDIPKASTARLLKTLEKCGIISCVRRGAGRSSTLLFIS